MKILHTIPTVYGELNGPSYSVTRLCETLVDLNCDVELFSLKSNSDNSKNVISSINFKSREFSRSHFFWKLGISRGMNIALREAALSGEVSILHTHSLWMMPNVYPGIISRKYRISSVVSPRGTLSSFAMNSGSWVKKIFWPLIQRPAIRYSDAFHATSYMEYLDIRRLGFRQPVAIIPNGIDIPEYRKSNLNKPLRTLLFLGRIHPIKGLDMLLKAWADLEGLFPDWQLKIAGPDDGEYALGLKRLSKELALKRVVFSGPALGVNKWSELADADLFVLPTHSENFGVAVAEALASGTPVVVTKGAPWGRVEEVGAGWSVDITENALLKAFKEALPLSKNELNAMGLCGRSWMASDFSWGAVAIKMRDFYSFILLGGAKPDFVMSDSNG